MKENRKILNVIKHNI